jgi:hypothetical protein
MTKKALSGDKRVLKVIVKCRIEFNQLLSNLGEKRLSCSSPD